MRLLREDAVLEMPPQPTWFAGRAAVGRFLATRVINEPGQFRLTAVAANGQPGLAAYVRHHDGVYRAHAIAVLTIAGAGIARISSFNDPGLFPAFGMPQVFPATGSAARR